MNEDKIELSLADQLEIVASGGNGAEYVNITALLERAAFNLRMQEMQLERAEEQLASQNEYNALHIIIAMLSSFVIGLLLNPFV